MITWPECSEVSVAANSARLPGSCPGSGQPLEPGAVEDNQGWSIFSYLIAGMVAYGLLGWLVAWLTHVPVFLPVGALVGLFFAIGGVVWKYGRHP